MNSETTFNWSNKEKGKFVSKCLLIYSIKNVALGNLRRSVHWQQRNDPSAHLIWGSLSNNDGAGDGAGDGDGDENVTGKVNSHYFITLIPSRLIRQMLANFVGVEFQTTASHFRKRKRKSIL